MTAANAHVKKLVLSHRMLRTLGKEEESRVEIRRRFDGPIVFANDLDWFPIQVSVSGCPSLAAVF